MEHGWITTLRMDGSPRTTRVWFVETQEAIWIATSATNRKVADIKRDPRVSFAAEGQHGAMNSSAALAAIDSRPDVAALLSQRYGGWDVAEIGVDGTRVFIRLATEPR